jgi:hypothetical protein
MQESANCLSLMASEIRPLAFSDEEGGELVAHQFDYEA